jgi:hypothetical protein
MGGQPEVPQKQVQVGAITLAEEWFGAAHLPAKCEHNRQISQTVSGYRGGFWLHGKFWWTPVPTIIR